MSELVPASGHHHEQEGAEQETRAVERLAGARCEAVAEQHPERGGGECQQHGDDDRLVEEHRVLVGGCLRRHAVEVLVDYRRLLRHGGGVRGDGPDIGGHCLRRVSASTELSARSRARRNVASEYMTPADGP